MDGKIQHSEEVIYTNLNVYITYFQCNANKNLKFLQVFPFIEFDNLI